MVDIGWVTGNIIGVLVILATVGYIVWASVTSELDGERALWVWGGIIALVVQIGWNIFFNFPFNMSYHSYRPVYGTVADVNSRFLASGSGNNSSTSQKYAIRLTGSKQIYGCEDTRCSLLKKGDTVMLNCERQWQYASVPGYDCRYNQ
jgi:hypothetical protein